ncbi:hypothetical protein CQW23_34846 [Capsicum baccatum]|uniref:MBD domain-containing protein n=1 Tax=Capsicum baccatum TaxID=33114 RepID=A0A2G2UXX2_CAPBA|nr:hypothetical protein CQW23_34846 [Capsicum baccatum]
MRLLKAITDTFWKYMRHYREYYYEPVSGKSFRSKPDVLHFQEMGGRCKRSTGGDATTPNSKKQKKSSSMKEEMKTTSSYSDSLNPPQSVCWVLTDSSAKTLTPFIHGNMIPEGQKQEWDAVFLTVSQRNANRDAGVSNHRDLIVVDGFLLWRRNRQKVFHLNSVHDVQVWSVIGVVEPVNLKHFTRMDICEKFSQVRAMEAVTNACVGIVCLYCTILGVAPEYYYEPVSGKKFRSMPEVLRFLKTGSLRKKSTGGDATPSETPNSKKQKKRCSKKEKNKTTSFYSDCLNPPQSVCWALTDSSADTWAPFVHGNMVPEGQRQEWDAVFSTVSQRNANRDAGVSNHRDLIVFDGFLLWCRNREKVLHLNSVHDVQVWSELWKELLMLASG